MGKGKFSGKNRGKRTKRRVKSRKIYRAIKKRRLEIKNEEIYPH